MDLLIGTAITGTVTANCYAIARQLRRLAAQEDTLNL
jgi:hypothetical protein